MNAPHCALSRGNIGHWINWKAVLFEQFLCVSADGDGERDDDAEERGSGGKFTSKTLPEIAKRKKSTRYEIYPDECTSSYRRDPREIILSKLRSGNKFEKARMAVVAVDVETGLRNVREA
jgi:hypothetical protein